MADLHRPRAHPLLALRNPAVPGIADIVQEHRQRALIGPDRRSRPPARAAPRLHLFRRPGPWPRHRERLEPADQPVPALHQRPAQPAAALLTSPSLQHRLEQCRLGPRRCRVAHQHQRGCPREPARLRQQAPHITSTRCNKPRTRRNQTRCLILTPGATPVPQGQVRPRGVPRPRPPRLQPADLERQVRGVHANHRMMHQMQLRSLAATRRARAAGCAWSRHHRARPRPVRAATRSR
jgi:hypothetical protein